MKQVFELRPYDLGDHINPSKVICLKDGTPVHIVDVQDLIGGKSVTGWWIEHGKPHISRFFLWKEAESEYGNYQLFTKHPTNLYINE